MKIHQEEDRIPEKSILTIMAGVLVITAVGVLVAWLLATCGETDDKAAILEPTVMEPGEPMEPMEPPTLPAVAKGPEAARRELFRQPAMSETLSAPKLRRMQRFGWVDERAGVVHIPIERAMELYIEKHRQRTTPPLDTTTTPLSPQAPPSAMVQETP